jgi:hypothetical protein
MELQYDGLCKTLNIILHEFIFLRNFDCEGHNTYITVTCVHDSEMLAEINSMEVWMTSLHISSPIRQETLLHLMFQASTYHIINFQGTSWV